MEYLKIYPDNTDKWEKVWNLYESSFPIAERRRLEDHKRAFSNSLFHPLSVWEEEELLAIIFYWEWDNYRYIEYLAVSENMRGKGIGFQIINHMKDSNHTLILEIDPLVNELSVRRLQFYERAGFTLTPYRFLHLPYRLNGTTQELLILSYPDMITKTQHNDFLYFMKEHVSLYCEIPN